MTGLESKRRGVERMPKKKLVEQQRKRKKSNTV